MKLNEGRVRWIVRQKREGEMTDARMAEAMKVSASWVKRLWGRYGGCEPKDIAYPARMGRPAGSIPGRREHLTVLSGRRRNECGARGLGEDIKEDTGLHMPHNTIHKVLTGECMAEARPKKSGQRERVRFKRTYSNYAWHTDYKRLDDGRWFIAYMDDASCFITGFGVFEESTGKHALEVLGKAMGEHGRPASILTDHGSQSCANESESGRRGESESGRRGESEFEKELATQMLQHALRLPHGEGRDGVREGAGQAGHAARAGTHQPHSPTASWRGSSGSCGAGCPGSSARHTTRPSAVRLRAARGTYSTRLDRRIQWPG